MFSRHFYYKLVLSLAFLLSSVQLQACGSARNLVMEDDSNGNTYLVWSNQRIPYGAVRLNGNSQWDAKVRLAGVSDARNPMIAVSSDGKAVAGFIAERINNPADYTIYVSMFLNGSWSTAVPITDVNEQIINGVFALAVTSQGTVNVTWQSSDNTQLILKQNSATFGDNTSWTGPVTLP